MILKKIFFAKINYWPKLNNKEFNFCDDNNEPAKFVILIGKNGCGKTMLLNFLLQILILHYYDVYTKNINDKNSKIDISEICDYNVQVFFKDDEYNGKLNLTIEKKFDEMDEYSFSIDNNLYIHSFFRSYYYDSNSLCNSSRKDLINNLEKSNGIISIYMDEHIDFQKIGKNLKISPTWQYRVGEINFKNAKFQLFDMTKPDQINIVLNDNNFEYNEKVKDALEILKKSHIINKINSHLKKFGFEYDQNKKLIYENGSHYFVDSLSGGLRRYLSLLVFLITIFNNLKKHSKNIHLSFLFDEIEKSLCPNEQQKICEEIISYASKMNGFKYQFFIATHSPFVIKNFLNRNDTVIIDVENNGENIKKSKKILLNKTNKISYDEIIYLYYGFATSSYYISLYEKMKWDYKKWRKNLKDSNKKKENISDFLLSINCKNFSLKSYEEIYMIPWIEDIEKKKLKKETKINVDELKCRDNLTVLRNILAHDIGDVHWIFAIFNDKDNDKILKEFYVKKNMTKRLNKAKYFFDQYNKNFEELLKKQIETIRKILINWKK